MDHVPPPYTRNASKIIAHWRPLLRSAAALAAAVLAAPEPALAHATERAFVLLLPTGYYLFGGVLAVGATFVSLRYIAPKAIACLFAWRLNIATLPAPNLSLFRYAGATVAALLLAVGWLGPRDPLENALVIWVWTLWWVGWTLAHAFFGNLWSLINPFAGAHQAIDAARAWTSTRFERAGAGREARFAYPQWLGYWPAIVGYAAFAWFELVYPAPEDPDILADAIAIYGAINLAGMRLFGAGAWLEKGEAFSVFFRLVAGLAPILVKSENETGKSVMIAIAMPGAGLIANAPRRLDFALFVLLALSSVSFDGLSKTFLWLSLAGVNPLEFPGRSAMVEWNGFGLLGAFVVLASLFFLAEIAGRRLGSVQAEGWPYRAIISLAPISLGFHFAHYLTAFLVNVQYAGAALSDPLGLGWNLLGIADSHVTTSFLNNERDVNLIWNAQAIAVVLGHVLAVLMAQASIGAIDNDAKRAWRAQSPLAALMVFYTLFGLWLLSTPVVG